MTYKLVTLAVEMLLLDIALGFFYYGRLTLFAAQEIIGWAFEVLTIAELLDKIFDSYTEGDTLILQYAGKTTAIVCRGDLYAVFPDAQERQLFSYGLALRGAGRSRQEVKRALRTAHAQLGVV